MPNQLKPFAPLAFSSPPGGGEGHDFTKKKKKKWGGAWALPELFGLPLLGAPLRLSRSVLAFFPLSHTHFVVVDAPVKKKKKRKK